MNRARRQSRVLEIRHCAFTRFKARDQLFTTEHATVIVNLQRTDAGRDVDDAAQVLMSKHPLELMNTKTEVEIENIAANLDEQITIAGGPIDCVTVLMENRGWMVM